MRLYFRTALSRRVGERGLLADEEHTGVHMYNYNQNLIPRAREMRKHAKPQERKLWYDFLSKLPVRCQRQKIIGSYIADFYCPAAKLIIELDGAHHQS